MLDNLLAVTGFIPCDLQDMACWGFCWQLPLQEMLPCTEERELQVGLCSLHLEWLLSGDRLAFQQGIQFSSLSFQFYLLDMGSACSLYLCVNISKSGDFRPPKLKTSFAVCCLCTLSAVHMLHNNICSQQLVPGMFSLLRRIGFNITPQLQLVLWNFSFGECHSNSCWLTNTWIPLWFVINTVWGKKTPGAASVWKAQSYEYANGEILVGS